MGNSGISKDTANIHYVLGLGGFCNNRCKTCLCRCKGDAPRSADGIFDEAAAVRPFFNGFILSDGEPTLIENLPELLARLWALSPKTLQVHTNARRMMYADYASQFSGVRGVDYVVRVYSHQPAVHDACTGVQGSLSQTIKGVRNLLRSAPRGSAAHVEIPLLRTNICDVRQTALALWQLGAKSIWLTGGHPAQSGAAVRQEQADEAMRDIKRQWPDMPVACFFASDERSRLERRAKLPAGAAGAPLAGADTNNPFVFRKCRDPKLQTLLVSLPHTYISTPKTFTLAPAAAASIKGFLDVLGYPSEIVDMEAGKKRVPSGFDTTLASVFDESGGSVPLGREKFDPVLSHILGTAEPAAPALVAIASHFEIYNGYDINIFTYLTGLTSAYLKDKSGSARVALGYFRKETGVDLSAFADYVCADENFSEYYFGGLLNMLEYGDRAGSAVYGNLESAGGAGAMPCDMSLLPRPSYGALDMGEYRMPLSGTLADFLVRENIPFDTRAAAGCLPMQASLGCIHNCSFCGKQGLFTFRDPARLADGLAENCRQTGFDGAFFTDRTLNADENFLSRFCERMLDLDAPFLWFATARLSFADKELPKKMRAAGCAMLRLGVESGSEPVLAKIRRGFTVAESEENLALIAEAGIVTQVNILSGFAHERESDVLATVEYLRRNRHNIDFVASHESYIWQAGMNVDPSAIGVRLIGRTGVNVMGPFIAYDEIHGRRWDEIVGHKLRAYLQIERELRGWRLLMALNREADVLHIFKLGLGRDAVKKYLGDALARLESGNPEWNEEAVAESFARMYRFHEAR